MFFNVRVYKQHDTDILMLIDAGFPVAKMITKALYAYAHGEPLFYSLEGLTYRDISATKCTRVRLELTDKDTIHMFCSLTDGYKNIFCKTILRNALIQQNVNCFFKQDSDTVYQQKDLEIRMKPVYPGLEIVSPDKKIVMDVSGVKKPSRKKRTDNIEAKSDIKNDQNNNPNHSVPTVDEQKSDIKTEKAEKDIAAPVELTENHTEASITTPIIEPVINNQSQSQPQTFEAGKTTKPEDSDDIMKMFENL